MKLSLKVEYAFRVLAQLGRSYGQDRWVHIDELAKAEAVPANYLVQILNELRNGGLIQSRRGKQGGYALAKAPNTIVFSDIVRIIDKEMLDSKLSEAGPRVASTWGLISKRLESETDAYTLQDVLPAADEMMYYI